MPQPDQLNTNGNAPYVRLDERASTLLAGLQRSRWEVFDHPAAEHPRVITGIRRYLFFVDCFAIRPTRSAAWRALIADDDEARHSNDPFSAEQILWHRIASDAGVILIAFRSLTLAGMRAEPYRPPPECTVSADDRNLFQPHH